ncbi:MAG: response regulator transcription factor [Clostridiales bacterium]|nr:response regulator transcription factor [Clostridiales bacterium]
MSKKILVVDDETPIVDILSFNLKKEGYEVIEAYDGEEAINIALSQSPDLILLDVMLPITDGFTACRKIRDKTEIPIIMLTAREEEVDKVLGLELGADDYITKPFSIRELMARVKANLRRTSIIKDDENPSTSHTISNANILKQGDITMDLQRYIITKAGDVIDLTLREFELLRFLITRPESIFTREELLEKVWGYEYYGDVRTVDVTVRRLREKLEIDPSNPRYIVTKRGMGYFFVPNEVAPTIPSPVNA